jgi:hypothetical protein
MSDWPLTIDGLEYHPIPQTWVEHGVDESPAVDAPRCYAVSVARGEDGYRLHVRYADRRERVVTAEYDAVVHPERDGYVPKSLASTIDEWPATLVASRQESSGVLRGKEVAHFDTLWRDRLAESNWEVTPA